VPEAEHPAKIGPHDGEVDEPGLADLHRVGVLGRLEDRVDRGSRGLVLVVRAEERVRIEELVAHSPFARARVSVVSSTGDGDLEAQALAKSLREHVTELAGQDRAFVQELAKVEGEGAIADLVAAWVDAPTERRLEILHELDVVARLKLAATLVQEAKGRAELQSKIDSEVRKTLSDQQRKHILRQQLEAIRRELGEDDEAEDDAAKLRRRIDEAELPEETRKVADRELERYAQLPAQSPEKHVLRTYLELLADLPWSKRADSSLDLDAVAAKLEADHFGLDEPKRRVLEHMAVLKLAPKARGTVLCLVGPPGVGKTSLAQSIADATGRPLVRVSLGGVRDEAEIRGHRRTYIGALPGKIIQSLKKVGVNNPVFCLDEVDKMSMDFRGDPSAALLEVLDPEQNFAFNDHYLDLDYDLSDILFITTANTLPDIPLPLQDRMEIIRLPGYTEVEKYHIAEQFLVSKQIKTNGLEGKKVVFSKNALLTVIRRYTREAGVRNLEREIASICRKLAREAVNDKEKNEFVVTEKSVSKYLGVYRFRQEEVDAQDQVGMVTGLAWTPVGGELLFIETLLMPGRGQLTVTGKLGDVMQESARAALSYVRSRADHLMIDEKFHRKYDIHIHIPEGAIPKDGPSAGISMCTSLVSALTRRPVHRDMAMTGEITLRGRVLPIGGLKEKLIAAHRGGVKRVVVPKENEKDLKDVPKSITSQMDIRFVEHMDEVLGHALIVPEGEPLFKKVDIPLGMPAAKENKPGRAIN